MIKFDQPAGQGEIICDECGDKEIIYADDFREFTKNAGKIGWKSVKTGTFWEHYCFKCL